MERIEKSRGQEFAHEVDASSIQVVGNSLVASLVQVHDASVKPLRLELGFFKDAVQGHCGIIRLTVDEVEPLHPRFRLREGDVVLQDLPADNLSLDNTGLETKISASSPGGCEVTMRHRPFELEFRAGGRLLQRLNGRHLFNFERYRSKGAGGHAGLVDATDVDGTDLWEENFGGHTDSKPRGPASVGFDVSFESAASLVGLAEHATALDLGTAAFAEPYRFFNLDVFEYELNVPMALYGAVPFVTAIHRWPGADPSTASGFFFVNPSEGFVQVNPASAERSQTWWAFESGVVDAFMFAGPTPQAVMEQYHTVTGWARLPPISTLGKHQSRWNYVDVADAIGVNKKFDQHDIPYDVLWLDIEHTDGKKYFTWHPSHFAKPDELLDALAADKRKLVTIVDPHIKKDDGYDVFNKLKNMDFMTKTKSGEQYDGWCWPGTSFYPDFCNPVMRNQWAKFFAMDYYPHNRADLYTWNDMNEPSVFNGPEVTMPRDNLHKCHTAGYDIEHRDVHNVYGFYHHMATVQGHLERAPNVRPFVLTRSFFAGSHRHGAVWTGDNQARWAHLAISVPMLVSLSLSGISFAGADVPGFFFDPELELFNRWHQLGIWYPFYRGHAHLETKRREPWMMGEEVTAMVRKQVTVRYQLLPYWYTLFAQWAGAGLPILRPLWYHALDDAKAFAHTGDHFLVGEYILVRAVTEADAKSKHIQVYLPPGEWYDFWDDSAAVLTGGQLASVTLHGDRVPVFVRGGTILVKKMRRRRSAGAMVADPYSLWVYGQKAGGHVYIDDGDSHEYHNGAFIYDRLSFDGTALRSEAAPVALPAFGEARGLPGTPERHLRIERVVFVGLPSRPARVQCKMESGESASSEVTSEARTGGFITTVKKPVVLLGGRWSLELTF